MIRWLICLFWGHDIQENKSRTVRRYDEDGELVRKYPEFWCQRCQKYRKV